MSTTTYPRMTASRVRHGECPVCHKASRRTVSASQAVSPFNRNVCADDGCPLTDETPNCTTVAAIVAALDGVS